MTYLSLLTQDKGLSDAEALALAAREAQAPQLAALEGGDAVGFVLGVLLIVALVLLIYYLVIEVRQH